MFADGGIYEGEYEAGLKHGYGKEVLTDGSIYEGEYQRDQKHGKGRYAYANGNIYEGEFQRGQQHGKAKYTFADGTVDLFCFKAKRPVGQGVRWSADRAQAWELQDGEFVVQEISLEEAAQIAARVGLTMP